MKNIFLILSVLFFAEAVWGTIIGLPSDRVIVSLLVAMLLLDYGRELKQ